MKISEYSYVLGVIAILMYIFSAIIFGSLVEDYSQYKNTLAVLGSQQIPNANLFNVLCFIIPGILIFIMLLFYLSKISKLNNFFINIGLKIILLSSVFFTALGFFSRDLYNLASPQNQYFGFIWGLWWISALSGSSLISASLLKRTLVMDKRSRHIMLSFSILNSLGIFSMFIMDTIIPAAFLQKIAIFIWVNFCCLLAWRSNCL